MKVKVKGKVDTEVEGGSVLALCHWSKLGPFVLNFQPSPVDKPSMSALLETSLGDIVIDLLVDESPKACEK